MREKRREHTKDLTVGEPRAVLWKFCLPLFGSIIFQQLYNIADSFVAGKYTDRWSGKSFFLAFTWSYFCHCDTEHFATEFYFSGKYYHSGSY